MTIGVGPSLAAGWSEDAPLPAPARPDRGAFGAALAGALDSVGDRLRAADGAERAFAAGRGGLQEMVVARAQADVQLALAATAASRATQALSTILGMQV